MRPDRYLLALLVAGFSLRLLISWLPVGLLIQKVVSDDAFYYFIIARNMALGYGATVDRLNLTNGFHPLWALVLAFFYRLAPADLNLPIHLGLSFMALVDVFSAWLSYAIVHAVTGDRKAARVSCLLYVLNPRVIMESDDGLEMALGVFFFALSAYWYLTRITTDERPPTTRDYAVLGAIAGLMGLARSDLIVLYGLILLVDIMHKRLAVLRSLLVSALTFALVLSPWLVWNQLTFGTIVQSSGISVPYLFHRQIPLMLQDRGVFLVMWHYAMAPVISISFFLCWRYAGVAWTVTLVALILGILLRRREGGGGVKLPAGRLLLPMSAALILVLIHTIIRWYPRHWYYMPLAFAAALYAGPALTRLLAIAPRQTVVARRSVAVTILAAVLLFGIQGAKEWREGFYPWQTTMLEGAHWVAQNIPPDNIVGAFNAGILGYYSNHIVVNLDGVTNWQAFYAIREMRLFDYVASIGITYLVDYKEYVDGIYHPFWGPGYPEKLEIVHEIVAPYETFDRLIIYRVTGDEE